MTVSPDKSPRGIGFIGIAMSITLPLLRMSCRGTESREERRRITRLIAVAWCQFALYLIGEGTITFFPAPLARFKGTAIILSGPILCAGFVVGMLILDRKAVIEPSVPYVRVLNFSVLFELLGCENFVDLTDAA
jgi:hypothetical protein